MHDAQNATIRNNRFGPMTVAGTRYPHNGSGPEAMQFSESADPRSRTDLWYVEAYGNRLDGETMDGCETFTNPDKLRCRDDPAPNPHGTETLRQEGPRVEATRRPADAPYEAPGSQLLTSPHSTEPRIGRYAYPK